MEGDEAGGSHPYDPEIQKVGGLAGLAVNMARSGDKVKVCQSGFFSSYDDDHRHYFGQILGQFAGLGGTPNEHLGLKGRHRRREADHVPQRGNRAVRADAPRRHRGPRRDAAGACRINAAGRPPRGALRGPRAAGRWPGGGAGLDRGETRRGGSLGRTPLPCREPSRRPSKARGSETGLAAAAGNGTPQPPP